MKINHLMVNWAYEDEELFEPYEWQEDDPIEWLFHIELLHVDALTLQDCVEGILIFDQLEKGYYVMSDLEKCLVIAVSQDGRLCMRSTVEYHQRNLICTLAKQLPMTSLQYEIEDYQQPKEYGLTRFEKEKKQLLLAYLDIFDYDEISVLASGNWSYIENGYHLFHEYLFHKICKEKRKT